MTWPAVTFWPTFTFSSLRPFAVQRKIQRLFLQWQSFCRSRLLDSSVVVVTSYSGFLEICGGAISGSTSSLSSFGSSEQPLDEKQRRADNDNGSCFLK